MDGIAAQKIAKYTIVGICRQTSDHITWIDIFYGYIDSVSIEIRFDGLFKIYPDVFKLNVAGGIAFGLGIFKKFLSRAFRRNNDRMSSVRQTRFQRNQQTIRSDQIEIDLRD